MDRHPGLCVLLSTCAQSKGVDDSGDAFPATLELSELSSFRAQIFFFLKRSHCMLSKDIDFT